MTKKKLKIITLYIALTIGTIIFVWHIKKANDKLNQSWAKAAAEAWTQQVLPPGLSPPPMIECKQKTDAVCQVSYNEEHIILFCKLNDTVGHCSRIWGNKGK